MAYLLVTVLSRPYTVRDSYYFLETSVIRSVLYIKYHSIIIEYARGMDFPQSKITS